MEIITLQIFIYFSGIAGIIAALANLRKEGGKLTHWGILLLLLICGSTLLSSTTQYCDFRKQQKAEIETERRTKAITDSINVILGQMRRNQRKMESMLVKAQTNESLKQEIQIKDQNQKILFKSAERLLDSLSQIRTPTESTKPTSIRTLTVDISRTIDKPSIFIDGQLSGTCHKATYNVADGIHKITVSYKNKLDEQSEYSRTINVTADMTLFIKRADFRQK